MANPALFTARAGWDQIHPLTQLALQPVEWRNAATSSFWHSTQHYAYSKLNITWKQPILNSIIWEEKGKVSLEQHRGCRHGKVSSPSLPHSVMTMLYWTHVKNPKPGSAERLCLGRLGEQGEVAAGLLEPCQAADVSMGVSLSGLQACVACTKVTQCSHHVPCHPSQPKNG